MKRLKVFTVVAFMLLSLTGFSQGHGYGNNRSSGMQPNYEIPAWAPPFYTGAHYFYLPDIECYYDLFNREFIFLYHGQWRYSPVIPSMYDDFNLENCFVVVINIDVYQPWLHHQYYLSHYPRYYYRDYYDHSNIPYVRGFDENYKHAIFWTENERNRARNWDNENMKNNRQFKYSKEDRQQQRNVIDQGMGRPSNMNTAGNPGNNQPKGQPQNQTNRMTQTPGNVNMTHQQSGTTPEANKTHETNYYGKTIGTPVKVEKQMRNQKATQSGNKSNNGNRNVQRNQGRR